MYSALLAGALQVLPSLLLDTTESWIRMLIALAASVLVSLAVGIYAARSERAGRVILPVVDVLQTLPILAFFPFALYIIVAFIPSSAGVNVAVIFLIMTSMLWNIIFGVYESIKTLPKELLEVVRIYRLGYFARLRKVYIPAAMPKVVEQASLSWAIGLFYLVTSEIFSVGATSYKVNGIGVALTQFAFGGNFPAYVTGLVVFVAFVIATKLLLFDSMGRRFSLNSQFAPEAHPRLLTQHGLTHRVRLGREAARLISHEEKRTIGPIARLIMRRLDRAGFAAEKAIPAHKLSRYGGYMRYIHYAAGAVIVLAVLSSAGLINGAVFSDEKAALIAIAFSFARVWLTFAVILIVAIPLCVYIVFFSRKTERFTTIFQVMASIPATIVLPIIVLALSGYMMHSELVAFAVYFLSGIWYILFGVLSTSKTLSGELFEVKGIFGVKGIGAWKDIYLKAIAPGLITGAVTGIAAEWNASIVAEYFTSTGIGSGSVVSAVNIGIGRLLDLALANGDMTLMVIALINLTVMIVLVNTFVWKRLYRGLSDVYS